MLLSDHFLASLSLVTEYGGRGSLIPSGKGQQAKTGGFNRVSAFHSGYIFFYGGAV